MDLGFRTLVRVFLLVGGLVFAATGGSTVRVGFGVGAALLGGFGLWWELRESSTDGG